MVLWSLIDSPPGNRVSTGCDAALFGARVGLGVVPGRRRDAALGEVFRYRRLGRLAPQEVGDLFAADEDAQLRVVEPVNECRGTSPPSALQTFPEGHMHGPSLTITRRHDAKTGDSLETPDFGVTERQPSSGLWRVWGTWALASSKSGHADQPISPAKKLFREMLSLSRTGSKAPSALRLQTRSSPVRLPVNKLGDLQPRGVDDVFAFTRAAIDDVSEQARRRYDGRPDLAR